MYFFEVVNRRRSVRKLSAKEAPESVIQKCLKSSSKAPNSSNLQPWEFYWIRNSINRSSNTTLSPKANRILIRNKKQLINK